MLPFGNVSLALRADVVPASWRHSGVLVCFPQFRDRFKRSPRESSWQAGVMAGRVWPAGTWLGRDIPHSSIKNLTGGAVTRNFQLSSLIQLTYVLVKPILPRRQTCCCGRGRGQKNIDRKKDR